MFHDNMFALGLELELSDAGQTGATSRNSLVSYLLLLAAIMVYFDLLLSSHFHKLTLRCRKQTKMKKESLAEKALYGGGRSC